MRVLITTTCGKFDDFMNKYDKLLRKFKKATVKNKQNNDKERIIEIFSLEDLLYIQRRTEQEIIILDPDYYCYVDKVKVADMAIEIYDSYRD